MTNSIGCNRRNFLRLAGGALFLAGCGSSDSFPSTTALNSADASRLRVELFLSSEQARPTITELALNEAGFLVYTLVESQGNGSGERRAQVIRVAPDGSSESLFDNRSQVGNSEFYHVDPILHIREGLCCWLENSLQLSIAAAGGRLTRVVLPLGFQYVQNLALSRDSNSGITHSSVIRDSADKDRIGHFSLQGGGGLVLTEIPGFDRLDLKMTSDGRLAAGIAEASNGSRAAIVYQASTSGFQVLETGPVSHVSISDDGVIYVRGGGRLKIFKLLEANSANRQISEDVPAAQGFPTSVPPNVIKIENELPTSSFPTSISTALEQALYGNDSTVGAERQAENEAALIEGVLTLTHINTASEELGQLIYRAEVIDAETALVLPGATADLTAPRDSTKICLATGGSEFGLAFSGGTAVRIYLGRLD